MEVVDTSKQSRLCDSFHAVANNISKGLSDSAAAATNGHCTNWAEFCLDMELEPLLFLYRVRLPILNASASQ